MTNKVGIGIEAQLDTGAVEQQINAFGQRVAQANKMQFNPVSVRSVEDLKKLTQGTQEYLKVADTLRRRVKDTGQAGKSIFDLDWERMFPNRTARINQMNRAASHVLGEGAFSTAPGGGGGGGGWGPQATRVAQAGLRGAGPVGNVAAGALGTGMQAGFGAGMMGLLGGIMALGVGKIVSSVHEKVGAAEDHNVALDRLKRTLGDVNVSFSALKSVVHGSADNLKITYVEAGQLATQFSKLGNLSSKQANTLHEELGVGVGLSRSFGLDPSQGVGVMGNLRGAGVTSNAQDSRRFALLIGETIGKSNAFAKADEVMEALAGYATAQTRSVLGRANSEGYAGMFSSMVGSGVPGLDPMGASALLNRVNSALSSGGAKGEASQFLTARVGQRLGLDPLQTQVFREGGMFATKRTMFGQGSAYARYMGAPMAMGSDADTTHFHARLAELKRDPSYSKNPMLLAQAMANDTGLNMNQAMELMKIKPNQMGSLSGMADLSTLNGKGIGNLAKANFGTSEDRRALAGDYWTRTGDAAISEADRKKLGAAAGNDEALKGVLTELAAKYDQQQTVGKDVHESKALLENIKINMADKLVPYMNDMRLGILSLAGAGKGKSPREIMGDVLEAEKQDRIKMARAQHGGQMDASGKMLKSIEQKKEEITLESRKQYGKYTLNPEAYKEDMRVLNEQAEKIGEIHAKNREAYEAALKKITDAIDDSIADNRLGLAPGTSAAKRSAAESGPAQMPAGFSAPSTAVSTGKSPLPSGASAPVDGDFNAKLADAEKKYGLPPGALLAVAKQETGGRLKEFIDNPETYHYGLNKDGKRIAGHTGKISTAFGPFGILESTANKPGYGVSPLKDKGIDEQIRFAAEYLAARSRRAGSLAGGLAGYGEGEKYSNSVMRRIPSTPLPQELGGASPVGGGQAGFRLSTDPIVVRVEDQHGNERQAQQQIETRVKPTGNRPFGAASQ